MTGLTAPRPVGRLTVVLTAWLLLATAHAVGAASVVDPALRFRRVHTAHFVIYFHRGEEALAARLARIAEDVYRVMGQRFSWSLPARTHVILVDQTDAANGWATPLPYNTVLVTAAWPSGFESIGYTDDWLRLVFAHEFTHIAHLDRSRGWARAARSVFGRVPFAFPNLSLPGWQIEGLATYFESAVTGRGRRVAADFRAIEREPARGGERTPLDRVNGGLVAWPGGHASYASGLGFHEHLAERFGEARLVALADATAGRVPYTGSRSFRRVFEQPLGRLWADYQAALSTGAASTPPADGARRLTDEAYDVAGARFLPPACPACPAEIAYSVRNPHEFPALKVMPAAGGEARTLSTRYLGTTLGVSGTTLVFDQRELRRNVSVVSDLVRVDRRSGRVRILGGSRRLQDPDLAPDGRTIVATRQAGGSRHLVTTRLREDGTLDPIATVVAEADTQFATPRWSPDGRRIAVERHRLGERSEVVLVDVATGLVRTVATGSTRAVTPAWRPDGQAVVAAVDLPGEPFNLFEFRVAGDQLVRRRLTSTTGGALSPDVSPDGRTLIFIGYTARGYDVFSQPYDEAAGPADVPPLHIPSPVGAAVQEARSPGPIDAGEASPYRPWTTLWPRAWMPAVTAGATQTLVGFTTGGSDVLGYHAYALTGQWRVSQASDVRSAFGADPDWSAAYAYNRWVPVFYASVSQTTSFLRGSAADAAGFSARRERTTEVGVQFPVRRVRRSQRVVAGMAVGANSVEAPAGPTDFHRTALRTGWAYRTARTYGYSISAEDGFAAGVTAEWAGGGLASLDRSRTVTADARAYVPGLAPHHVLALRGAAGTSAGPREFGRTFRLGGAASSPDPIDFSDGALSLFRGFAADTFAGRRAALVNAEYRLPVARVERGHGTLPLFVRQVHASVFTDVGHAWTTRFASRDVKVAVGAELSADVVLGFGLPLTVTTGIARGRDGAGRVPDSTLGYVRVGRAF